MHELYPADNSTAEYDNRPPLEMLHDTLQHTFLDATDPEGSIARQREMLQTVIAEARNGNLDSYGHAMLDHYETVVDYMWFGGHSDDPPAAVAHTWAGHIDHDEWGTLGLNASALSHEAFDAITALLMPQGLDALLMERQSHAEQNKQALYEAFTEVVDGSPGGAWFAAFNTANPLTPTPPTTLDKLVHRTTITDFAMRTFGPDRYDQHSLSAPGRRYVEQQMRLYEDEELLRRQRSASDLALRGLQRYGDQVLATDWRPEGAEVIEQELAGEEGYVTETYSDGSQKSYDPTEVACKDADKPHLATAATRQLDTISREVYVGGLSGVYDGLTTSYAELRSKVFKELQYYFLHPAIAGMNLVNAEEVNNYLEACKTVSEDYGFDETEMDGWTSGAFSPWEKINIPQHVSERSISAERKRLVAVIEKYSDPVPGAARLLQATSELWFGITQGKHDEADFDLVLKLAHFEGYPYVPGYRLAAIDALERRYYFTYTPDEDPYKPDKTPLPAEGVERLTEKLDEAGHYALSSTLQERQEQGGLTAAELVGLSKTNGRYAFRETFEPDLGARLKTIGAFSAFLQDGTLRGTCGIHAQFGALAQGVLFDESCYVTGGYVLEQGAKAVSGVGHAQVVRADKDGHILSITDWTPASFGGGNAFDFSGSLEDAEQHNISHAEYSKPSPREASPLTLEQHLEAATKSLLGQLSIMLMPEAGTNLPDEVVFQKLKPLGHNHPAVRTIGALLNATESVQQLGYLPDAAVADLLGADALVQMAKSRLRRGEERKDLDALSRLFPAILGHVDLQKQVQKLTTLTDGRY